MLRSDRLTAARPARMPDTSPAAWLGPRGGRPTHYLAESESWYSRLRS